MKRAKYVSNMLMVNRYLVQAGLRSYILNDETLDGKMVTLLDDIQGYYDNTFDKYEEKDADTTDCENRKELLKFIIRLK